jgi:phage shock protein PspC (stress-responsive transcriptional regulator)
MKKGLRRSSDDKMVMGVCGGISDYLGANSSGLRLIVVLMMFISGILPVFKII